MAGAMSCYGQSLSLAANPSSPTGTVALNVILSGASAPPSAVQWSVSYPASSVASVTAVTGAGGGGKTVTCSNGNCILYGFDAQTVQNGVLAVVTFQLASGASVAPSAFQLANGLAASSAGDPVALGVSNTSISVTTTALPAATTGSAYSAALSASGGTGPYTWSLASGALPQGLTLNSDGTITGTVAGNAVASSFTAQVTDSSNPPASGLANFTISVGAGTTTVTLSLSGSQTAGQQPTLTVTRSGNTSLAINGTLTLTFASSVSGDSNDPNVQFLQANSASGSRQVTFSVPAASTTGAFANGTTKVSTGTVAGTITIAATSLSDSNGNAVAAPAPVTIPINASAPVITKVTVTSGSGAFTVAVTGFSTPRDMQTLTFHFVPTGGTTLAQPDVTVNVSSPFTTYYAGATAQTFGSQFTASVPFTFSSASIPVSSLTVTAANSQGTSTASNSVSP